MVLSARSVGGSGGQQGGGVVGHSRQGEVTPKVGGGVTGATGECGGSAAGTSGGRVVPWLVIQGWQQGGEAA